MRQLKIRQRLALGSENVAFTNPILYIRILFYFSKDFMNNKKQQKVVARTKYGIHIGEF